MPDGPLSSVSSTVLPSVDATTYLDYRGMYRHVGRPRVTSVLSELPATDCGQDMRI
jgi:hypothetical protein